MSKVIEVRIGNSSAYAYRWTGGEISVGDRVLLPPAPWHGFDAPPQIGVVTSLESDYSGLLVSISRRDTSL